MGFKTGDFPRVDPETFLAEPLFERTKTLALHWVEYGFGSPRMIHTIYVVKVLVLYVIGGAVLATETSGVGHFWDVAAWWNQPVVYQKLVLWTILLEAVGVAGSWGPLAGKFKPMTGSVLFWARPGTIRLRPWRRVPLTDGDRRTVFDVALYVAFLASLLTAILLPGARERLAVRGAAAQHLRAGQPRAADRADRGVRAVRPARQDGLPRGPR